MIRIITPRHGDRSIAAHGSKRGSSYMRRALCETLITTVHHEHWASTLDKTCTTRGEGRDQYTHMYLILESFSRNSILYSIKQVSPAAPQITARAEQVEGKSGVLPRSAMRSHLPIQSIETMGGLRWVLTSRGILFVLLCKRSLPRICDLEPYGTIDVGWTVDGLKLLEFWKRR